MKYLFVFLLVGCTSLANGQTAEQANCDEVEGFQLEYLFDFSLGELITDRNIPADYTGIAFECHDDGKIKIWSNYKDGKLDGLWRTWSENGQLRYEGNFKDGVEITQKCWNEDGNVIECPEE